MTAERRTLLTDSSTSTDSTSTSTITGQEHAVEASSDPTSEQGGGFIVRRRIPATVRLGSI